MRYIAYIAHKYWSSYFFSLFFFFVLVFMHVESLPISLVLLVSIFEQFANGRNHVDFIMRALKSSSPPFWRPYPASPCLFYPWEVRRYYHRRYWHPHPLPGSPRADRDTHQAGMKRRRYYVKLQKCFFLDFLRKKCNETTILISCAKKRKLVFLGL